MNTKGFYTLLIVSVILTGCANKRVAEFGEFSVVGSNYFKAVGALTNEVASEAIDTDTAILLKVRPAMDAKIRGNRLQNQDSVIKAYLADLALYREHTTLLSRYFVSMGNLASKDVRTGVSQEGSALLFELGQLSPKIANASIGGVNIGTLIDPVSNFVVGKFQQKALEQELRDNGAIIEHQLLLNQAYVKALTEGLKADIEAKLAAQKVTQVDIPFVQKGKLPVNWAATRNQLLSASYTIGAANSANKAGKDLHKLFVALIENKPSNLDFRTAITSLNELIDLLESLKST